MKKIISWCDNLYEGHKHLYNIGIGIIGAGIFALLSWLMLFVYQNIFWIVDVVLGVNNTLVGLVYESIAKGDGALSSLPIFSSILLGCICGVFLLLIRRIDARMGIKEMYNKARTLRQWKVEKVLIYFLLIYLVASFSIVFYKTTITTIFNQNINIVAPYVSDNELKEIQSKFAQMESKENFLKILKELEDISKKHNVKNVSIPVFPF